MACVLLLEDDDDLRESLAGVLQGQAHTVFEAENGDTALQMAKEHRPDLVVCDLIMAGTEGIATILGLRKLHPDLPILAISGNTLYLDNSEKLGADASLLKPFTAQQFLLAVGALLPAD